MIWALLGALFIVSGIAALIEASRHHPIAAAYQTEGTTTAYTAGWHTTTYDLVRIGGWALLIFGAVIVTFALVRELRLRA